MSEVLLDVRGLKAWQHDLQVLHGVDLRVSEGSVVALVGANGAGKSSLLDGLAGLVRASGSVRLGGTELLGRTPATIARAGLALVPEGRKLFPSLSIEENLRIGAASGRPGPWTLRRVYGLFPVLEEKRHAPSHSLSGGQQQMAAIGRGLMSNPRLLLCDEISLGLSPLVVRSIYDQLPAITAAGTSVVLVEQNTALALTQARTIYCLREGRVVLEGTPATLTREAVSEAYFGAHHA
jgi:branched-chain amino acid transport system ATP-binding protein